MSVRTWTTRRRGAFDELILREPPVRAPGAVPRFADAYREIVGWERAV